MPLLIITLILSHDRRLGDHMRDSTAHVRVIARVFKARRTLKIVDLPINFTKARPNSNAVGKTTGP